MPVFRSTSATVAVSVEESKMKKIVLGAAALVAVGSTRQLLEAATPAFVGEPGTSHRDA